MFECVDWSQRGAYMKRKHGVTPAIADEALDEGMHVGRTIVDGTHPDLTVLPLVTGGV